MSEDFERLAGILRTDVETGQVNCDHYASLDDLYRPDLLFATASAGLFASPSLVLHPASPR